MMEELLPFSERPALWIYEHADPQGQGTIECAALVLAKRPSGLLAAILQGVISEEELAVARDLPSRTRARVFCLCQTSLCQP